MHALRTRRGEYRVRTRTGREIEEAYYGVLDVYGAYRRAYENLLGNKKKENGSI